MAEVTCVQCTTPILDGARFCYTCGSPASPRSPRVPGRSSEPPPDLPARFRIVRLIGEGGMGRVYQCHDQRLEVDVAIKVLASHVSHDDEALARLEREARAAARFRGCPSILALLGFHQFGDTMFLEMEYAAGGSLYDLLKRNGCLMEKDCRRLGAEIADALGFAHARQVLHRDIKPANILLDSDGRIKVADFGIAKILSDTSAHKSNWTMIGTLDYMAPEQYGGGAIDTRADLYALGVMLYEMATAERPFRGQEGLAQRILPNAAPPDPRAVEPMLSEDYAAIVMCLLERDPERRFRDAAAVAKALRHAGSPPPTTRTAPRRKPVASTVPVSPPPAPPPPRPPSPSRSRRKPVLIAGVALLSAALALFAAFGPHRGGGEPPPDDGLPVAAAAGAGATDVPEEDAGPAPDPAAADAEGAAAADDPDPEAAAAADAPRVGVLARTDPPGATVIVNGVPVGVAGPNGLLLDGLPIERAVAVEFRLDGYRKTGRGWKWDGTSYREEPIVPLERATGTVALRGGIAGAEVRFTADGEIGVGRALAWDGGLDPVTLPTGTWRVAVTLPGHDPFEQEVEVGEDAAEVLAVTLDERPATLTVDTDPSGAEVFLDGERIGVTPLEPTLIDPGRHTVRFDHPVRDSHEIEIEVGGDEEEDLAVVELPAPAVLDLQNVPEGVTVLLAGEPVAGTLERRSGPVTLVVTRPKHHSRTLEFDLESGATTTPDIPDLEPFPATLVFAGVPSDCRVLVDGRPVDGSWTGPPGTHRVSMSREGFVAIGDRDVTLGPGESFRIPSPRWIPLVDVEAAVPDLPPPPAHVLEAQRRIRWLPEGIVRDVDGRLWSERDGMELVLVEGGEFTMGADDGPGDRQPSHTVEVSAFLIDRHEVTVKQFQEFCREIGMKPPEQRGESNDRTPVVNVSWQMANMYALTVGRRLPTEAEWEKAARGTDGRTFSWRGPDDTTLRNAKGDEDGYPGIAPCGSFPRGSSPCGALDMTGNVIEWCADWHFDWYYKASPSKDPAGAAHGRLRVTRGGGWSSPTRALEAATRGTGKPDTRRSDIGFRCAIRLP